METNSYNNSLAEFAKAMQKALASSPRLMVDNISDALSVLSDAISGAVTDESIQNITATIEVLAARISELTNTPIVNSNSDPIVPIPEETIASIQSAIPYLEEDRQATCQEFIQSYNLKDPKKKLTWSEAVELLSVLFALFSLIIQLLPNPQLDKIIEQNNTLIAQNEIIIQNQTNNNSDELESVLYGLSNGIHLLADEINSLRDVAEDYGNFSEIQGYDDADDTQQQNTD